MSNRIGFHLDENVDPDIALALRRQAIDVTTTAQMGLIGQTDEAQRRIYSSAGTSNCYP